MTELARKPLPGPQPAGNILIVSLLSLPVKRMASGSLVVDAGTCVGADIEGLAGLQREGNRVGECPAARLGAVDRDGARSALAEARAVVLEVELHGVLAGERAACRLDLGPREIEQVIDKDRLALEQVESPSAEATAGGDQHAVAAAVGHLDVGRDGERLVEDARRRPLRHADDRLGVGELGAAGHNAGPGR